nr:LOW QUALITY PROTEIN: protein FAM181B [Agelaius phoeniceus]
MGSEGCCAPALGCLRVSGQVKPVHLCRGVGVYTCPAGLCICPRAGVSQSRGDARPAPPLPVFPPGSVGWWVQPARPPPPGSRQGGGEGRGQPRSDPSSSSSFPARRLFPAAAAAARRAHPSGLCRDSGRRRSPPAMAVPAALLSPHHLLSFCFPAAGGLLGYADLEKGYEGSGGDAGDFREATRDLLSFIDSASSNIKLALDRPVKSRRKVNHRKYLQKQIKRCTGIIAAAAAAPPPAPPPAACPPAACPARPPPRREPAQAAGSSLQSKSLAALFGSLQRGRGAAGGAEARAGGGGAERAAGGPRKVPLRDRNLPPSFFTEPALPGPAARGPPAKEPEKGGGGGGAEATEFLELLCPEYGALLPEHAAPSDAFGGRLPAELGLEHGLYELPLPAGPHPLLGGLLYPEPPWSPAAPCSPPRKAPPEPLRPIYPGGGGGAEPVPGSGGSSEEPGGHLPAGFAPFFPECPLPPPQPPYDYGGGYHRGGYPGL